MPGKPQASAMLEIPPLELRHVRLRVVGDSPLITHNWSEKAKQEIRDAQQGRARQKKAPKVSEDEYRAAFHRLPDGRPGFPSVGFKAAVVDAATQVGGVTKVFLRGAFHIPGELVPIEGEPRMREDMVRVGMGTADMRYRPEFSAWTAWVPVRFNARSISLEQLVHLFNMAGFSVGVGEWRPSRDGIYGMFHVEEVEEMEAS